MTNLKLTTQIPAETVNNFIVEALTIAMVVLSGLLTFVGVAAAA